ncbi:LysE family translocator [Flavobacteriaceae bacterium]|nr:LysE family translocator [Flavobacteriaceae bacterium]
METLLILAPTIAVISLTPGMCMTLAFSLGLTQGYRRTLWMMWGEMLGVAFVVSVTMLALTWLLALDPRFMQGLAVIGGCYLLYIAWRLWHADDQFGADRYEGDISRKALALLGFTTAIMNPKGWAFMLALLPGFTDTSRPVLPQLGVFLAIMLTTEFLSMSLYASGGRQVRQLLGKDRNLSMLNRIAAVLMVAVSAFVRLS